MSLNYKRFGEGPPLLILHGLYGAGDNWLNIGKNLADKFTVYLIDQRNHGRSPHLASHTYYDMSEDLHNLVKQQNLVNFNILGHSMGGKVGITYALKYPGFVSNLVNVDISPFSYIDQADFLEQINYHKLIIDTFKNAPIDSATSRKEIEDFFVQRITDEPTRKFLLKNLKRDKTGIFHWKINLDAISKNLESIIDAAPPVKLGAISFIPTMFIRGCKSPYLSKEHIEAIPDVFPNAKFTEFENSGHWLHAEEPERFIEIVKTFLS